MSKPEAGTYANLGLYGTRPVEGHMTRDDRIALAVQDPAFLARFWAKVEKGPGCWMWTRRKIGWGHGVVDVRRCGVSDTALAHRVSWFAAHGRIPAGLCVLHRCDVPACVNPDHLFVGTVADNNRDMKEKGRARGPIGAANAKTRLTPDLVREIRSRAGTASFSQIGREYGVTHGSISSILRHKNWAHID